MCWLRFKNDISLITVIADLHVQCGDTYIAWGELQEGFLYSTDRINWFPCTFPAPPQAPAWFEPCPEWVMWQGTDRDGAIYGFDDKEKPYDTNANGGEWYSHGKFYRLGVSAPPANWRETLVARPKPKEVKTCATTAEAPALVESQSLTSSSVPSTEVASPAPQQSNPADRGADIAPQDNAADREWSVIRSIGDGYASTFTVTDGVREFTATSKADADWCAAIARERARAQARAEVGDKWTEDEIRKRFEEQFKYLDLKRRSPGGYVCYSTRDQYYGFLAGVRAAQSRAGAGEGRKP